MFYCEDVENPEPDVFTTSKESTAFLYEIVLFGVS